MSKTSNTNFPPHLKRVATLPCEILVSERRHQPETSLRLTIMYRRTLVMTASLTLTLLQINSYVCFERIFKIGQHLGKLYG